MFWVLLLREGVVFGCINSAKAFNLAAGGRFEFFVLEALQLGKGGGFLGQVRVQDALFLRVLRLAE